MARTQSIRLWKVLPALRIPKVMHMNSKSLNGVVMAILGMSLGFMGIWWYPFFRSIFEKILLLATLAVKSIMYGMG